MVSPGLRAPEGHRLLLLLFHRLPPTLNPNMWPEGRPGAQGWSPLAV